MAVRQQIKPFHATTIAAHTGRLDHLIDGSTDTGALVDPTASNAAPTTGAVWVANHPAARLVFGGTNAANEIVNYQVILWRLGTSGTADAYIPEVVARGDFTLGTDVYASTNIGAGTELWADTVTDTICRPGVYIYSPADNTRASIEIPIQGACWLQVITDLSDADTADVFVQLGEPTNPMAHLSRNSGAPDAQTLRMVSASPTSDLDLLIDGSVDTGALVDPTASNAAPTTSVVAGANYAAARLMFGGTTNAGEIVNYQVILWRLATRGANEAYVPEVIAKGEFTLGTDVYAATNLDGAGTNLWADTITDTINRPGVYVYSPADNTRALIEVLLRGAAWVQVITDLNDADSADVLVQLGEPINVVQHLSRDAGQPDAQTMRVEKAVIGLPTYGYDAAVADDNYSTILTTPNDGLHRHNASIRCATNNMIVSFDAGVTEHMYIVAGDQQCWFGDLLIAPNTAIQIKNADAGQNYAEAAISIW